MYAVDFTPFEKHSRFSLRPAEQDMWARVQHRWTFCTFGLVETKVDGKL